MYIQDVEDTLAISKTIDDSNTVHFSMLSISIQYWLYSRICLTIFQHLPLPSPLTWYTSWVATWMLMSNMLLMHLHDGMNAMHLILTFCAWPVTTLQYLVSCTSQSCTSHSCNNVDLTLLLATSVDVERLSSRGHFLLSHVHSRLSAQSTHALLCLGYWSCFEPCENRGCYPGLCLAQCWRW